jgi:tetratricopeptide (TPR) repeat protein
MKKIFKVIIVILITGGLFYLNLKPFIADIHYRRALELKKNIYFDKAVQELKSAIFWDPNYVLYHKTLGELYNTMAIFRRDDKLKDLAIKELNKATKLNPNDSFSYASLGWAYYFKGEYNKAENAFKEAIIRHPNNAYFRKGLEFVYQKINKDSK